MTNMKRCPVVGFTNFTAYISPYLVLNNGGFYTKHIYIGSQRIVSKLGSSNIFALHPKDATKATKTITADAAVVDYAEKQTTLTNKLKERYALLDVLYTLTDRDGAGLTTSASAQITTPLRYYYHSDHFVNETRLLQACAVKAVGRINPFGHSRQAKVGSDLKSLNIYMQYSLSGRFLRI